MEQHDAGLVQSNEGIGSTTEDTATKFGSGLHCADGALWRADRSAKEGGFDFTEPTSVEGDTLPEAVLDEPEVYSVAGDSIQGPADATEARPEVPEQQAFIGEDGQVHEVPPELIGPDGKMLPFNEKTMRMLRGKYFTVRHVFLSDCGHKIDMINQPKTNCENCWYNWMNRHGQLVETADEFYRQYGKDKLVAMRGARFVKMFLRFMSTVNHFLEQQKAQELANGNSNQVEPGQYVNPATGDEGRNSVGAADGGRQVEVSEVVND
jgi:hypothetical protein